MLRLQRLLLPLLTLVPGPLLITALLTTTTTPLHPTIASHRQRLVEGIEKGEGDVGLVESSLEFLERSWTPILTKDFFDLVVEGEWDLLFASQRPPPADPSMYVV